MIGEPASGEVWANSEFEFTISFSPESAADYACLGFLEVVGRETRLPLKMQATGIGPQASSTFLGIVVRSTISTMA